MSLRLLILAPDRAEPRFAEVTGRPLGRLAAVLAGAGVAVEARPWTEADDTRGFDAVSPLLAWSYHARQADWAARLERLAAGAAPVVNPAEALRWNTTKTYLAGLEAAGVPIVPTLFVEAVTPEAIAAAHDRFGDEIIAKPQVSGGAFATVRIVRGAAAGGGPAGPAMLQPFLPAVAGEGEISLLFFGGVFSHAVGKVARAGDFRVQSQHGGAYAPIAPPAGALAVAARALAAAGRALAYARVDLIRDPAGALRLMELEAIEPDLYLQHAPDGGAAFARAMRRALEEQLA
jgi:glutathione synthase/RimK-type ligase-like ATP-grasp enzyme